jgi:hypothetical protein
MLKEPVEILLIEDNPGHVELVRRGLSRSGMKHAFHTVPLLSAGLAMLGEQQFDVVLSDLSLPDSSGLATVHRICEQAPAAPVIVLTSLDDEDTAVAALDCGAQDYIVKDSDGITWPRLRQAIHYAVQRQLMRNEKHGLLCQLQEATGLLEKKNRHLAKLYRTAQEFVDHVSHEFRTPLSIIKEYASLVRDGIVGQVNEDQWRLLNVIDDRSDDLNTMVDDMLDISKLKAGLLSGWRKPCTIAQIVQHVLPALERKAVTRAVTFEKDIPADLPTVYCDAEKAGRVIINLVVNAIKFAGEPGLVRVWARSQPDDGEVVVGVTDNGPGIDEKHLAKIFRRFSQLDNNVRTSTKGFGLGLSIAKELTTINLGSMTVQSQRGSGSTFEFTIPYAIPREVVGRYLARLAGRSGAPSCVSILVGSLAEEADESLARDVDRFLNYLLRRHDLLFRMAGARWLLVLATPSIELPAFIKRIEELRRDANRNRPRAPLPNVLFHADGTWNTDGAQQEILARVEHWCPATRSGRELRVFNTSPTTEEMAHV